MKAITYFIYIFVASKLPGTYGGKIDFFSRLRLFLARHFLKHCGINVTIESNAYIGSPQLIEIGDHSGIGSSAYIQGPLKIGNYVMMAPEVRILTQSHETSRTDIPMALQGNRPRRAVSIEDDVWIGTRAIILPGVTIERGSIIAAGTVVTRNVPPYSICAGVPGKIIGTRHAVQGT